MEFTQKARSRLRFKSGFHWRKYHRAHVAWFPTAGALGNSYLPTLGLSGESDLKSLRLTLDKC